MRKAPPKDSQRPDQRDYLPSPIISVLTLKVLGVLAAILGTACTLALASKPQQVPRSATSTKIAVKSPNDVLISSYFYPTLRQRLRRTAAASPNSKSFSFRNLYPSGTPTLEEPLPFGERERYTFVQHGRVSVSVAIPLAQSPGNAPQESARRSLANLPYQPSPNTIVEPTVSETLQHILSQGKPQPEKEAGIVLQSLIISQAQISQGQPAEQAVETRLKSNQQESAPKGQVVQLTLSDIVILALQNNRALKNAYLERIAEREDLAVAEGKFLPNFTPTVSVSIAEFGSNRITTNGGLGAGATVSVKVPTGGELSFSWAVNGQTSEPNGFGIDTNGDIFEPNLQLRFNQPLLRGAGINLNRASIDIARLTEQVNILNLKSILIDTITSAIFAYRNLLQAQEQLKIEQQSLELAQQILEVNRALIEAGRLAPVDIVQSQTAVANRQVSLLTAQNNLEATKLALIDLLDIDQNINIVAAETALAKPTFLDSNKLRQLAFKNRPDYLRAQLNQKTSQLQLLLAEDDKRWDLNLITSLNNTLNSNSDVRAGLVLSREFGDLTKEQRFVRSRVNLLQAENTLKELNDSIKIQVTDKIRDVNLRFSQVERARQATVLSERQLDIEREKQRLGRGSGIFELVRLQNDLVSARNAELEATIEYLNALTRLDQTLGTTLDTWQVTLETQ